MNRAAIASGLTRVWTRTYTQGLPVDVRGARRAEIDSDLWEQRCEAGLLGHDEREVGLHVLARLALGIPADLAWRLERGISSHSRRTQVIESRTMLSLVAVGVVFALFMVLAGIASVVDALLDSDVANGQAAFGAITVLAGAAVAAGLLTSRRNPLLGIGLVAAGAITVAVAWYWMLVITIPIGIAMVAIAYFRGRTTGWPRGAGTA
jgi:hypothetical protein